MEHDDDFWDLVERGKRRLGFDDPLPSPPKPLKPRPRLERRTREPGDRLGRRPAGQPADDPAPPEDSFWTKAEKVAGKRVQPAAVLQAPDFLWRHVSAMKYRHSVYSTREGEALGGEELIELEVAAQYSEVWPASKVPQDLWQHIKQGRVRSQAIQVLAPLLIKLTEAPGQKMVVDFSEFCERLHWGGERKEKLKSYLLGKEWAVYNFRDWADLHSFEARVNKALIYRMAVEPRRDGTWEAYEAMYGDIETSDDSMEIFRYLPDGRGGWRLHPTVEANIDMDARWADPPLGDSHSIQVMVWTDITRTDIEEEEFEQMMEKVGYKYSLAVAKEMILWRVEYIGYALLAEGL